MADPANKKLLSEAARGLLAQAKAAMLAGEEHDREQERQRKAEKARQKREEEEKKKKRKRGAAAGNAEEAETKAPEVVPGPPQAWHVPSALPLSFEQIRFKSTCICCSPTLGR